MVSIAQGALRASQFLWTLLTLSLIGAVIAGAFAGNPASINYAMFVSVFDMLVVLWGIAAVFNEALSFGFILIVADSLATLFTLIAGIVLAARLHVHSCGNQSYITSNGLTNGSHHPGRRCHELQASCAFFWFAFASFLGSVILGAMGGGSSSFRGGRGGIRKGGPSMSQV